MRHLYQPTLFEQDAPQFDKKKTRVKGKIFVLDHDTNANGRIDIENLEWRYMKGDGDFRSDEVTKLRDEADVIVTNPPFSLFREFLAWILEAGGISDLPEGHKDPADRRLASDFEEDVLLVEEVEEEPADGDVAEAQSDGFPGAGQE